jgi:hypothetical protein
MAGRIPGMSGMLPRAGLVVLAGRSLETPGLDNVGSLTSHNPTRLHGLLRGQLYLSFDRQNEPL